VLSLVLADCDAKVRRASVSGLRRTATPRQVDEGQIKIRLTLLDSSVDPAVEAGVLKVLLGELGDGFRVKLVLQVLERERVLEDG
jgi:hypothetical protein